MLWLPTALTATLIGSFLLTFVYSFLYFQERERYLLIWSVSWGIYTVRYVFSLLSVQYPDFHILTIGNQLAAVLSGAFLLWGTYIFTNRKWNNIWTVLTFLSAVWVVAAVYLDAPLVVYSAPGFTLLAVIYILTGVSIFQMQTVSSTFTKITGVGFILWGIHKADYPIMRPLAWFAPWGYMLSAFLEFLVAIGILLVYFQKNHADLFRSEKELARLNADLELRVEQRTAQLERAVKEMESFSYSVSHDLRAPVRAITGFSDILKEEYSEDFHQEAKMYLDRIISSSARMDDLIQDLLMLSRVGRQDLNLQPVNLSELAQRVFESQRQSIDQGHEVSFTAHTTEDVLADKNLMELLLSNLISNALKFSARTEKIEIEFGCSESTKDCVFYIKDNGIGFDMSYVDKLFTAFHRLHDSEDFEGTGIGLATVRRIVERHNGEVWANAKLGEGATFFFSLNPELSISS